MIKNRFLCKTNEQGITTIFVVVVMLLLFTASCNGDNKEVVVVAFDPETTYTLRTTDYTTQFSDSGITRYRAIAKEFLKFDKAKEPFSYFPEGIYVEKFDTLFNIEASLKADTAYNYEKKGLWKLIGNVRVENLEGKKFETSLLFWDQKEEKVYSDKYIRIQEDDKIITGIGFESNQNMTQYKIFNSQGVFPVSESVTTDSAQNIVPVDSMSIAATLLWRLFRRSNRYRRKKWFHENWCRPRWIKRSKGALTYILISLAFSAFFSGWRLPLSLPISYVSNLIKRKKA